MSVSIVVVKMTRWHTVAQRCWWWWLGLREWVAAQWHRGGWHVMVVSAVAAVLDMLAKVRLA